MAEILQAPKGGAISPVNQQFYEGGEFMPDTGLFCGIKKKAKKWAKIQGNWSDLTIQKSFGGHKGFFVVAKYAGSKYEKYLNSSPLELIDAQEFAKEVLKLRNESYSKAGLVPHPTRLFI